MTGCGTGVGPPATIGPSVGVADVVGAADGSIDGVADGSTDGPVPGSVETGVASGVAVVTGAAVLGDAVATAPGELEARATSPPSGRLGATAPAVSATVARMRFNTPMATTRRAR